MAVFTTEESAQLEEELLVKQQSGKLEAFSRDKLFLSLYQSLQHRKAPQKDATGLTNTVVSKLKPYIETGFVTSAQLKQVSQVALTRFDAAAGVSYAAFHS